MGVVEAVGHHDAGAVHALPQTYGEGILLVAFIERLVSPAQLLRGETNQAAVLGDGGQCPAKSEAVGQEDVGALHTELPAVVLLAQHDVTDGGLGGGHQGVGGVPACTADVPTAILDVFLHLLVLLRIVFLHPGILHAALEVENVVGILLQQKQVLVDGVPHILLDGGLDVPVPLGVQVGVGHQIGLGLSCRGFLCRGGAVGCRQHGEGNQGEQVLSCFTHSSFLL